MSSETSYSLLLLISTAAFATVLATLDKLDGRSWRNSISTRYSIRECQWIVVVRLPGSFRGWFKTHLRCTYESFIFISTQIECHWLEVNGPLGNNAHFLIRDRVAVALHYLTHPGAFNETSQVFGMGKASAIRYLWEVVRVINFCLKSNSGVINLNLNRFCI